MKRVNEVVSTMLPMSGKNIKYTLHWNGVNVEVFLSLDRYIGQIMYEQFLVNSVYTDMRVVRIRNRYFLKYEFKELYTKITDMNHVGVQAVKCLDSMREFEKLFAKEFAKEIVELKYCKR